MSLITVLLMTCLSLLFFTAYNFFCVGKFGVQTSLSKTAYKLDEIKPHLCIWFSLTLGLMGATLLPAWLVLSEGLTFQFLTFLSVVGIFFVAATPHFLEKQEGTVHRIGAFLAAGAGLAWCFVYSPIWWVVFIYLGVCVGLALLTKSIKCVEYWLEMIAFYTIYTCVIHLTFNQSMLEYICNNTLL